MAKFPRFGRPRTPPLRAAGRGGVRPAASPSGRGSSLRFRGRTPSQVGGGGAALAPGRASREMALRIAFACLALCFVMAWARGLVGNVAPWPAERTLQIFRAPALQSRIGATLQPVACDWWETFGATGAFVGEIAGQLDPQQIGAMGALWLVLTAWLAVVAWFALAQMGNWKRPSLPFALLLISQLFGAFYYLASFRSPPRRLQTVGTAFDFHTHTTRSNGLLTPQQQINWHRARGFKGLAFTDANSLMPQSTLAALQRANPDMLLLDGCEYHGRDAHLLFFGLKRAISSRDMDARRAILEAKKQGAIVIVPHPWSPARYSAPQFRALGVDGFEPWNGAIGDAALAKDTRARGLIVTGATDTLSKSGDRCWVWTLLPRGMDNADDVMRALKRRKTGVAFAVTAQETPRAFELRRRQTRGPGAVIVAIGTAWRTLSTAQKLNALLGLIAFGALWFAWGAESARAPNLAQGPQSADRFVRRKRFVPRAFGVLLMIGAFALSILVAVATMSGTFKSHSWAQNLTPLYALLLWPLCDALFFYGRALWRRVQ